MARKRGFFAAGERDRLEREAARLHVESQIAEGESRNANLAQVFEEIDSILAATLKVDDYIDLESLKIKTVNHPPFRAAGSRAGSGTNRLPQLSTTQRA